jgi:hypothetical protein
LTGGCTTAEARTLGYIARKSALDCAPSLSHAIEFDAMKPARCAMFASLLLASWTCMAADGQRDVYFLQFPSGEAKSLGEIDHLVVTVDCSWVAALRNVPELYSIDMGYDIPTVNVLDAEPRLGAAAVELSRWNGVIGVHLPAKAHGKSCFEVTVTVEGRSGEKREWHGPQLGLPR